MKKLLLAVATIAVLPTLGHAQFLDERGNGGMRPAPTAMGGGVANAGFRVQFSDVRLATTLERWARQVGWQVRWDAPQHVLVEGEDNFGGTFQDAVTTVLSTPGIQYSKQPLEVCFYPNTPPLARITLKGEQSKECH